MSVQALREKYLALKKRALKRHGGGKVVLLFNELPGRYDGKRIAFYEDVAVVENAIGVESGAFGEHGPFLAMMPRHLLRNISVIADEGYAVFLIDTDTKSGALYVQDEYPADGAAVRRRINELHAILRHYRAQLTKE